MLRELLLGDPHALININSFKFLFAVLLIHTIGPQTAVVLPGFVQGLVESLGFDDKQAGFIVSAELVLVSTITVLSMLVGLTELSHAINNELYDVADAFESVNQTDDNGDQRRSRRGRRNNRDDNQWDVVAK